MLTIFIERLQEFDNTVIPVLRNASDVIELANSSQRKDFIDSVQILIDESKKKWRIREVIAENLFNYAKYYEPDTVFKKLWGPALTLCADDVWYVRKAAAKNIWKCLDYCKDNECIKLMKIDLDCLVSEDRKSVV